VPRRLLASLETEDLEGGEAAMSEGDLELEAAVQDQLQEIAEDLKKIEKRLRALHGSLPAPSTGDREEESEEENDVATELRAVIDCVLTDSIGPAIRDLLAAAAYSRKKREPGVR
jgi:hypothetical protein